MHPKTIGLVAHTGKPAVAELVNAIIEEFSRYSMSILLEKETAVIAGKKTGRSIAQLGAEADMLVVAGGDGTILHVVGQLGEVIKPIFGINVGSLGFLTCANSSTYRVKSRICAWMSCRFFCAASWRVASGRTTSTPCVITSRIFMSESSSQQHRALPCAACQEVTRAAEP